jgi:hypothetical protein
LRFSLKDNLRFSFNARSAEAESAGAYQAELLPFPLVII